MNSNQRITIKQTILIGSLTFGAYLLVAAIQWIVLVQFGPGYETDALFTSLTIPQFVMQIASIPLLYVLVPMLSEVQGIDNSRELWHFFIIIGGAVLALTFVLYVFAPVYVPLIIQGASEETKLLASKLTRIQVFGLAFTAINAVLRAGYHSRQRFYWPEFVPLLNSVIGMGILLALIPLIGIDAAAWANVIRLGLTTLLLLPVLGKFQKPKWREQRVQEAFKRTIPLLLGTGYFRTDALLDRWLLSMAPTGELSLLYFGQQLYDVVAWTIGKTLNIPMVPALAILAKEGDWQAFRSLYRRRFALIILLFTGGYLILLLFGKGILQLVIGYGAVTSDNVLKLWWVLVILVGFIFGSAAGHILAPAFYAKGNTITPTRIQVLSFTMGIALKVAGFLKFGLLGVAAGTSIYFAANNILTFIFLEKELQNELMESSSADS